MKNSSEIVNQLELQLKFLSFEDMTIKDTDSDSLKEHKLMQQGKKVAYEKMLSFINNRTSLDDKRIRGENTNKDNRRPIIVC